MKNRTLVRGKSKGLKNRNHEDVGSYPSHEERRGGEGWERKKYAGRDELLYKKGKAFGQRTKGHGEKSGKSNNSGM